MQRTYRTATPAMEKLQMIMGFLPKENTKQNMAAMSFIYPNFL